jgi:hypothetical protein
MGRLLDHEVILVPRAFLPAIAAMISGKEDQPLWTIDDEEADS